MSKRLPRAVLIGPRRTTRLVHGDLFADIVPDRKQPVSVWFYVVQRSGSPKVLAMGSSHSEAEAEKDALNTIRDLQRATLSAA